MVKAIFFDIDGTLVSFKNHQIPKSTFDALYKLKEKGIKLFIATGRGKDGLDVLNDFPFDGYITLNGQYCYTNNQIIYSNTIKKEDLQALLDYLKDHQVPCGFTEENTKYFNYRDERVDAIHAITHNDDHPAGDCSHVIDKSIYQIMCFVDENEEKEILSHMPHCISARWHPTFCDISPIGGTKQLGIDKFLEYYGLDLKDTMAFGDGGNDMQMLQHVSLAVAMGNAGDELKSIADFVTKDVDDEGMGRTNVGKGYTQMLLREKREVKVMAKEVCTNAPSVPVTATAPHRWLKTIENKFADALRIPSLCRCPQCGGNDRRSLRCV